MSEAQRGARLRRKAQRSTAQRPIATARRAAERRRAPDLTSRALHARRVPHSASGAPGGSGQNPQFKRVDPTRLYQIKRKKRNRRKKGRKNPPFVWSRAPGEASLSLAPPPRGHHDATFVTVQVLSPPFSYLFPPLSSPGSISLCLRLILS